MSKEKLNELKRKLQKIKNAPELHNSCSIDFKIDNTDYYLKQINSILDCDIYGGDLLLS